MIMKIFRKFSVICNLQFPYRISNQSLIHRKKCWCLYLPTYKGSLSAVCFGLLDFTENEPVSYRSISMSNVASSVFSTLVIVADTVTLKAAVCL